MNSCFVPAQFSSARAASTKRTACRACRRPGRPPCQSTASTTSAPLARRPQPKRFSVAAGKQAWGTRSMQGRQLRCWPLDLGRTAAPQPPLPQAC